MKRVKIINDKSERLHIIKKYREGKTNYRDISETTSNIRTRYKLKLFKVVRVWNQNKILFYKTSFVLLSI